MGAYGVFPTGELLLSVRLRADRGHAPAPCTVLARRAIVIVKLDGLATRKRALDGGACGCVERSLSQADLREHLLALASCAPISRESE